MSSMAVRQPALSPPPVVRPTVTAVGGHPASTVAQILASYHRLEALPSLEPGPATDAVFGELVAACTPPPDANATALLQDARVRSLAPRLRRLCSEGEFLLERAWACRIAIAGDSESELSRFPYLGNYKALTRLELHALAGVGLNRGRLSRVCLLGGGPLPISALLMQRELSVPVDVVDRDPEAVRAARRVVDRLAPGGMIHLHHGEAETFSGVARADVVVLAALVGADAAEKRGVLRALHATMRPGSVLVMRSAHGLRTLLYPPVALEDLAGWRPLSVVHPFTDVINSVVVAVRDPVADSAATPG